MLSLAAKRYLAGRPWFGQNDLARSNLSRTSIEPSAQPLTWLGFFYLRSAFSLYTHSVYTMTMAITRVFRSGNSQAVRIPREYRLDATEVEIIRRGDELVLRRPPKNLGAAFDLLAGLSPDFLRRGRRQPKPQKRPAL